MSRLYHRRVALRKPATLRSLPSHRAWLLGVFALAIIIRLPTLGQPLVEKHDWRQTQTAYAALIFAESGIDLLHPKVPVLGPPFDLPFEFPLYQAAASIPMMAGVPPDLALRVVGLGTYLFTAYLLFGLIRRIGGVSVATATLAFFLFSPFGIVWSRTSMIEFTATSGALVMLWAGIVWRERGGTGLWGIALIGALVTMLVKPTTGVLYILPLLAYRTPVEGSGFIAWIRSRLSPGIAILVIAPALVGLIWIHYADTIKAASPLTAPYTSDALFLWNFGTVGQRLHLANWFAIARRIGGALLGVTFAPLLVAALIPIARSRHRSFWVAMAMAGIAPIVVFFNLYRVHDYYLAAISPIVAAFLGIGAVWVVERVRNRWALALLAAGAIAVTAAMMQDYVRPIYQPVSDESGVLPMSAELARLSLPGDLVLVLGRDWSPSVHYYARRTGLAMPPELLPTTAGLDAGFTASGDPETEPPDWWAPTWLDRQAAQTQASENYRVMISDDPSVDPIWLADRWPWMGVLGPRTYVLGNIAAELRGAPLVATAETVAMAPAGRALLAGPLTLVCSPDVSLDVPSGVDGTWLSLAPSADRGARIRVVDGLAPILVQRRVVVSATAAPGGSTLHLSCAGTPSIVIEAVQNGITPATGRALP